MSIVDAIVKKTDAQLIDSAEVLQEILVAAADERGEWHLPLEPERVASMRAALDARADRIDEALLSNAFAWMRKATDDKHDGERVGEGEGEGEKEGEGEGEGAGEFGGPPAPATTHSPPRSPSTLSHRHGALGAESSAALRGPRPGHPPWWVAPRRGRRRARRCRRR